MVKLSIKNPISFNKNSIINEVSGGISKVSGAKFKIIIMLGFLAKFKLLVELSPQSGFLTLKARLAFAKLRQAFIKALIFHYFDLKCHICVQINALGYIICRIFS